MHVIFDLDGTLIDSQASILDSLSRAAYLITRRRMKTEDIRIGAPIEAILTRSYPNLKSSCNSRDCR